MPTEDANATDARRDSPSSERLRAAHSETITATDASDSAAASLSAEPYKRYKVEGEVGRGGLGRVLLAHDQRLRRDVAIKELLTAGSAVRTRFAREVEITASLQHPAIVPVYDAGTWDTGEPYYVMKLLSDGRTLKDAVKDAGGTGGRLALLTHVIAAAEAIAYAHSVDIIHRDLKPSNVLVGPFGETVVIDWGLAKQLSREPSDDVASGPYRTTATPELTSVGSIMGTPQFMAPEQARGDVVDKRADVYSLGALLYHVVSGEVPFQGVSSQEILVQLRDGARPDLRLDGIPADLAAIIRHAMAPDLGDRYADAGELVDDLRRFHTGQLVRAQEYSPATLFWRWAHRHRALLALGGVSLVVLLTLALVGVRKIDRARQTAERERATAIAQRNQLIQLQAQSSLEHDPTMSLAWLKTYPLDGADWRTVQILASEARSLGVAQHVIRTGVVNDNDFLPDGASFVTVGFDGTVAWWDVATEKKLASTTFHATGAVVAPDGKRVGLVGDRGEVALWELTTGQTRTLDHFPVVVYGMRFSSDGQFVAAAAGHDIRIYDLRHGGVRRISFEPDTFDRIVFTNGTFFAAGSAGTLLAVRAADGDARPLAGHHARIRDIAASPDGQSLVSGADDGTVRLWSIAAGSSRVIDAGASPVTQVRFAAGDHLVWATADRVVSIGSVATGHVRRSAPLANPVMQLVVAHDGTHFATSGARGTLRIWDAVTGEGADLRGPRADVIALTFSRDDTLIASGMDASTRVWPRASLPPLSTAVNTFDTMMMHVVFSPDGSRYASEGGRAIQLCVTATHACRALVGHEAVIYGISFSGDGKQLVSAGWDGTARLWDVATGEQRRVFKTDAKMVRQAQLSPDGQHLVAAGNDGLIYEWPVAGGPPIVLRGHQGSVGALAISSMGTTLASGGDDHTVRLWDAASGAGRVLGTDDSAVLVAAFAPDGAQLATASRNGTVRLWDVGTGTMRIIGRHRDLVTVLQFTTDGRELMTCSWDGTAGFWNLATGRGQMLTGHTQRVRFAALSPDERLVATASDDQEVRIWDLQTGAVDALHGHTMPVRSVTFSPDGTLLASASEDKTVRLWQVKRPSTPKAPRDLVAWMARQTSAALEP